MDERELAVIEARILLARQPVTAIIGGYNPDADPWLGVIPSLVAEVRRLRVMLIPMAEVLYQSSLRNGVGEYDTISAGRLTTSLGELRELLGSGERPDTPLPTRRVALRKMTEDAEAQGLYDQPEVSAG